MGYFIGPITSHLVAVRFFGGLPQLLRGDLAMEPLYSILRDVYDATDIRERVGGLPLLRRPTRFTSQLAMRRNFPEHFQAEQRAIQVFQAELTPEMVNFSYPEVKGAKVRDLDQLSVALDSFLFDTKFVTEYGYEKPQWLRVADAPSLAAKLFSTVPKPGATHALVQVKEINSLHITPNQLEFVLAGGRRVVVTRERTYD